MTTNMHALQRGNQGATAEYQKRMSDVWKKYDANPFTNMLGGLAQAPIFIGFFSAIRALAAAKVGDPIFMQLLYNCTIV